MSEFLTKVLRADMFSTAVWHLCAAEYDGVKIGERVVGYAAEECRRMIVLESC
jgi:hypothetical protein